MTVATVGAVKNLRLLDYIVSDVLSSGTPVTETSVRDLLTTLAPSKIRGLSSAQAIVADRTAPNKAVMRMFPDETSIMNHANDTITMQGKKPMRVWEALESDIAPDFVMACIKMPPEVCRWYVIDHLSQTGLFTPSTPDGWSITSTEFEHGYLDSEVRSYLKGPVDTSLLDFFGLAGKVSVKMPVVSDAYGLLLAILYFLDPASTSGWSKYLDDISGSRNLVTKVCSGFGLKNLLHMRQAAMLTDSYDTFLGVLQAHIDPAMLDTVLTNLKTDFRGVK